MRSRGEFSLNRQNKQVCPSKRNRDTICAERNRQRFGWTVSRGDTVMARFRVGAAPFVLHACLFPANAGATTCVRTEFEAVVDQAAAALRDLNNKNRPEFQEKLRSLKQKRGWTHDEFMTAAAPFVKDENIEVFDLSSGELLATIATMGQEGAEAEKPDCKRLVELRGHMAKLVETQSAKWNYMFGKLDEELSK